jgi:DNA-binding NarL/FixJ family response regulator
MACPAPAPDPQRERPDPEPARGLPAEPSSSCLSAFEVSLLAGLADGLSMDAVARRSGLSTRTVRRHLRAVCDRIDARSSTQAVAWAARRGLV